MKFCKENLPIMIHLKMHDEIIESMMPLVISMAKSFSKTKTPSYVLDIEDYVQGGLLGIFEATMAMDLALTDHEEYWSKFLYLVRKKIQSKLIEMQKKNYLPVKVSQNIARLHPKIHEMIEEDAYLTAEDVMEKFGVSKNIANELIHIARAEFDTIDIAPTASETTATMDITVENTVNSGIFVEELLSQLNEQERDLFEHVALDGGSVRAYAQEKGLEYTTTLAMYHACRERLRKIVQDE